MSGSSHSYSRYRAFLGHCDWLDVAGDEATLDQCGLRVNYNLQRCTARSGYVFVRCGAKNLVQRYEYWGNIRFATDSVEAGELNLPRSALRAVNIQGAGTKDLRINVVGTLVPCL